MSNIEIYNLFIYTLLYFYIYFFGYGEGDLILSALVTLTIIGMLKITECIAIILFQLYKYFAGKNKND